MAKLGTMSIEGSSGSSYAFDLYPLNTNFKELGGVYVFTKRVPKSDGGGSHTYLYVGQTGDLSSRFTDHHKEECMDSHGANCICIHLDSSEDSRLTKEGDILGAHDWPCNG